MKNMRSSLYLTLLALVLLSSAACEVSETKIKVGMVPASFNQSNFNMTTDWAMENGCLIISTPAKFAVNGVYYNTLHMTNEEKSISVWGYYTLTQGEKI